VITKAQGRRVAHYNGQCCPGQIGANAKGGGSAFCQQCQQDTARTCAQIKQALPGARKGGFNQDFSLWPWIKDVGRHLKRAAIELTGAGQVGNGHAARPLCDDAVVKLGKARRDGVLCNQCDAARIYSQYMRGKAAGIAWGVRDTGGGQALRALPHQLGPDHAPISASSCACASDWSASMTVSRSPCITCPSA